MGHSCTALPHPHMCMSLQIFAHTVQLLSLAYNVGSLALCPPQFSLAASSTSLRGLDSFCFSDMQICQTHSCLCTCPCPLLFLGHSSQSPWFSQPSHHSGLGLNITRSERPPREASCLSVLLLCLIFFVLLPSSEIPL